MFTKPLTRAPWYILMKSFFLAIGQSYLHDLSHTFLKRLKLLWGYRKLHVKSASFSTEKVWMHCSGPSVPRMPSTFCFPRDNGPGRQGLCQLNDSCLFISYRTIVLKHFALILAAAWEPVLHTLSPPRGPPYRGKCPKPLGLAICAFPSTDSCHSDRDCGGELLKCCQGDCSKYCLEGRRGI